MYREKQAQFIQSGRGTGRGKKVGSFRQGFFNKKSPEVKKNNPARAAF